MEALYMIFGLAMFYFWIHSIVIIIKKTKDLNEYEKVALWIGLGLFVLYLFGSL
jgi:hypothetical protein